ncbi:breast cancer type 2 susceptibility protein [Labrus mixtus]|uniref:breast cancer type 2 susceptibility protein n=1 Tax=Labrus mixtus TaxID=508554 RepID=UPI0029C0E2B9|nr:breast cancer type 2 susceptibility protein [Labrus mixtus]
MDLPSKNMYDKFRDEIWKELGPLDPDWFETLTAQTSTNEEHVSDQDELCANQEGHFKTPFDKTAVDSQLFSTPKVFRNRRVVSPATENEPSFTAEQEIHKLTATQSPCLFQTSKDVVPGAKYDSTHPQSLDSFDLLHTPQKSPRSYAKQISESLGAEIHPDMSWTSSLNTPTGLQSTLILTKPDESPCRETICAGSDVVLVRKLFPSLSNASKLGGISPENTDMPSVHQGVCSPEAVQKPESHDFPSSPMNQSDGVWRQKLPDAIEDGEIRSTVANVLEGAENVLSIFFTNSSSALRKVKTDRIKRKQIIPTEEPACSSTDISATNNAASRQQGTADQEPERPPSSPPVKTVNNGITQWSPLSLSEIPACTASCFQKSTATQVKSGISTKHLQKDSDSATQARRLLNITDSGFTKKKRTFIYSVKTSKQPEKQRETNQPDEGDETTSHSMVSSQRIPDSEQELNMKQWEKAPDEAERCSIERNEKQSHAKENLPLSVQTEVQDFDMSQLCRDFAQDIREMSDPDQLSKEAGDIPGSVFSPSACLSAMKQAKKKARQTNHHDCDGISNRRHISTAIQNSHISEVTISDSGFQSAVTDITHMTAASFALPSSEKNSQQWSGFKTDVHRTTPPLSSNKEHGKVHLDHVLQEAENEAKLSCETKKGETLGPSRASEQSTESTATQLSSRAKSSVNNIDGFPLSGHARGSLPAKPELSLPSVHASGFKTASNKGIQISSANLQRAKRLFEETESDKTSSDQTTNCAHDSKDKILMSNSSVEKNSKSDQPPPSNDKLAGESFQLTASQRADVTELCTLLEEADSQFEFTQFKTAKLKQHGEDKNISPLKVDKELDPDFLAGIDFDDSFSLDAEKHQAVTVMHDKRPSVSVGKRNCEKSNISRKATGLLLPGPMTEEKSSAEDLSLSDGSRIIMSAKLKTLDRVGHTETSMPENKSPLKLGVGFKTAGGNVLRVSKKCLNKARALFADLEGSLVTSQNSPDNLSRDADAQEQHKQSVHNHTGDILNRKESNAKLTSCGNEPVKRIEECFSNVKKSVCLDEQVTGIRDEEATKSIKNSKMDRNSCGGGFQMASGKGISTSTKAMQEADAFFKDCDITDSKTGMSVKAKEKIESLSRSVQSLGPKDTWALKNTAALHGNLSSSAKTLSCTAPKNIGSSDIDKLSSSGGGFCSARGKKVFVSAEAMKKAERLLTEDRTPEETDKQPKENRDHLRAGFLNSEIRVTTPSDGGFQTASGKGVPISAAALKKAKSLFNECDEIESPSSNISVKTTHPKMQAPRPAPRSSGFLAAGGKSVALSAEALKKAKAVFSDIGFDEEIPSVSDTRRKNDKEQKQIPNTEKIHLGFSTAGGSRVHVSQKNLLKAKNRLKDFDDSLISATAMQDADEFFRDHDDSNDVISIQHKSTPPLRGSGNEQRSLSTFKDSERVKNFSEESGCGRTEFENVNERAATTCEKKSPLDGVELHKGFNESTLDSANGASLHGNPALMTKPLSSSFCTTSNNIGPSAISKLSAGGGFCTASGKKVSVSEDAMTKARSLLSESATLQEANNQMDQKEGNMPPRNDGFQTASGKGVSISSAALKKAKTLLSECDEVKNEVSLSPTRSKTLHPCQASRSGQFLSASGKQVAFSSEALQKAKALFSDIGFSAENPAVSDLQSSNKKQENAQHIEKMHHGFTTAGGAKVHVSQNNLLKAKTLLKEFADGESHDSKSTNQHDTSKWDLSKAKDEKRTSHSDLTTERYVSTEESDLQAVTSTLQQTDHKNETLQNVSSPGCIIMKNKTPVDPLKSKEGKMMKKMSNLHDSPREEMSSVLDTEMNQTTSSEGSKVQRTDEPSVQFVQSLNLSGCTDTQQKLLAQEALDCTKALLEDESAAGQSLSMTSENVELQKDQKPTNRSVGEHRGKGKRPVDDPDMTGQPPPKRRLLEEFDRTVDSKVSTLNPEISTPNVLMKDRRVFKYSVSLHPNITRPHRSGNQYVESKVQKTAPTQHSTPGGSRSAQSRMPAFVPPFLKNAKTQSCRNAALKDNIRTPPAFVPPFKKQRMIVQESSSKPQEEGEDKHCNVSVMPANSNTYVPPTKKTQSTADITGHESIGDDQMMALEETTCNNQINKPKLAAGCGLEDSAAHKSHAEGMLSGSREMLQNLHNIELARDMQDMRIRKKKRQTIRPLPGSLFLTKTSGVPRLKLKAAVNGKPPARYSTKQLYESGVHQHVCEITSEAAESFRFRLQQFIRQEAFTDGGGVQLADGGWLIPSNDGTAGKQEFYRALCDSPGVDPKLISEEWVYNHYRWIVWKQASMERSFPETMGSLCLTPEQVLLQLKYRYDVEVDHSRRPALRKIMEKDDTAVKTLVLCVCGVISTGHAQKRLSDTKTPQGGDAKPENTSAVVWLTDGWYSIKAQLDEPLTAMLQKGRLYVGGKLIVHGAQLVGSQDACSPLEAPESLMLKICANSSRPTRWDTKLGFHRDPRPFLLPVSSLYSNGGPVGCADIIILRSYPIQWMERKSEGGVVFRSVRAEEKEARRYNGNKQKAMEILFAKIQAEFEKEEKGKNKAQRRRRTISRQDVASLQDGEELYEAVEQDPAYLEAHLSEQQLETLRAYRRSQMEKKQTELQDRYRRALESAENSEGSCPKRDVTPVWRLCFADSMGQPGSMHQLNLWRPTSDLQSSLKEGCRYKVYNLSTSDGKKVSGSTSVQLTGTKKTQFQDLQTSPEWLSTHFQPRVSTHFMELRNQDYQPLCGEVDLAGYVISIVDGQGSSPAFYLADGKLDFVKVRCFSSLVHSGLEDLVKPRVLLALSNLQLRGQSTYPTPVVYAGDLTSFSTNPKEVHLQESCSQLRSLMQGQENFFLSAEERLSHLVRSEGQQATSSPALQTRTPSSTADRRQSTKTSVTAQHQVRSHGSFTPVGRNPPATNSSTEKDPSSLKRRRALDYLSRIPSPPPLAIMGSVSSPCVNKTFNPPRRSGTPGTLKSVQTPARKPVNPPAEEEWVNDEELALIDTQALLV